jgi:soluble lytic murein transglycosylase-like protein
MLLGNASVQGDLFRLVAAWNGGPGNLSKWWRKDRHKGDPMLFIESIPLRETRIFIERVIANYWIYRMRFGLSTPTLDAVAAGEWPRYPHFEAPTIELAQDEPGNR